MFIAGGASAAVQVKLEVEDPAKVARKGDVVTTGVPFEKGAVKDVAKLGVTAAGKKLPAQFIAICPWEDGSVRWALMDTQVDVPAGGKTELVVSDAGAGPAPAHAVKVDNGADGVKVSTGPMEFVVSKKKGTIFDSIKVGGKELVTGEGKGMVVIRADKVEVNAEAPSKVEIEQAGPMKAIVCLRGNYMLNSGLLCYTVRITAYAGQSFLKTQIWLENNGAYGYVGAKQWLNFDGMYVDLGLGLGNSITAACEGVSAADKFKVEQTCPGQATFKDFKYTITGGDKELKTGDRTDGDVALSGSNGKLTVAIRYFWQNYEKTIELADKHLKLWLWPDNGQWPRSVKRGFSGGEMGQFVKADLYALPGGVHKSYQVMLDFSGRDPKAALATLSAPLMAKASPEYYAQTEAAPGMFAPGEYMTGTADYDGRLKAWNKMIRNGVDPAGNGSLIKARNGGAEGRGFWYGWMDFGDLYWAEGASSLHYDWTWIMLMNYLRLGDRGFLDMGTEMAWHRIDVDELWSDKEDQAFRGLTRYEKGYTDIHGGVKDGYYKPITSHHWASGVALYYMLTGDEAAKECTLRSAMGVRQRQVSRFKASPNAGGQPRESGWSILVLCAAYDVTGDKQYLDDALLLFTNNLKAMWKEKGTFFGGKAESPDIQYLYCLQPLCELHHHTGNEEILALLKEGAAANPNTGNLIEINHLSNLYGYVGLMEKNQDYIKKGEAVFAKAVQGDNPACYGGGGAWTKETGKRVRYGQILHYAHWKLAGDGKK